SKEGESDTSIATEAPSSTSASPSPVSVLTPVSGDAATASWSLALRQVTTFEPIRPVPPITAIFMMFLPGSVPRRPLAVATALPGREGSFDLPLLGLGVRLPHLVRRPVKGRASASILHRGASRAVPAAGPLAVSNDLWDRGLKLSMARRYARPS